MLALLVLAATATAARALDLPARPSGRVSDYANLLDASERAALERRLAAFEDTTSSQIVVAIFPSLEEESLEDFTNRLFAKWALGQAERDNGVLLAIFIAERRARIEVGYGLEGVLTDAMSARILRERLTPAFREQRYAEGIAAAVQGMEEATRGEFKADPRSQTRRHSSALAGRDWIHHHDRVAPSDEQHGPLREWCLNDRAERRAAQARWWLGWAVHRRYGWWRFRWMERRWWWRRRRRVLRWWWVIRRWRRERQLVSRVQGTSVAYWELR